jgi:hypothetical protein
VQSDRIRLYRHLLGFKSRQGHVVAFIRKQG